MRGVCILTRGTTTGLIWIGIKEVPLRARLYTCMIKNVLVDPFVLIDCKTFTYFALRWTHIVFLNKNMDSLVFRFYSLSFLVCISLLTNRKTQLNNYRSTEHNRAEKFQKQPNKHRVSNIGCIRLTSHPKALPRLEKKMQEHQTTNFPNFPSFPIN